MKLLIGLIAALFIFSLSSLNWRRTLKVVFFLIVIEGALRKWVLPQANEILYFLKDLVLLGAYFNFYCFSGKREKFPNKGYVINILIFLVLIWCVFQLFNPSLGSPVAGLLGLRGYLLYIPLIWMVPLLFQSEEELHKFLRRYFLLVIPVGLIGIIQFFSPATSFINAYSNENSVVTATFGAMSSVRITGTFSYISGYAIYLIVSFGILISLFSIPQPVEWKVISVVELFLVVVNSFMTGSRSVIFAQILFIVCYVAVRGIRQPARTLLFMSRLIVPTLVIAIAAYIWFRPAIDAFVLRTTSNKDVPARITGSFQEPIDFLQYKQLDGYGTGATHQAAPLLRKALDLPPGEVIPVYVEPEMGRILLELGPIGFLFWYGLRVSILIALISNFWHLERPLLRQLALAAFLIQAIQINGHLVFHHTFSVYYWFLSSFVFLLPRLQQIENWQREQQFMQEYDLSPYFPDSSYR
ncbi:MAG TPA: hypothetical protein DCE56_19620 [Cyanobacteria bacterium UBA8553]|nr:hypothetical protein [Cyanobacteria bacterium UBA8553]